MKKKAPFIRFGSYLLVDKIASGGMADGGRYSVEYRTRGISSVEESPAAISGRIYRAVGEGIRVQANVPGPDVFGGDAFDVMIRARDLLIRDDGEGVRDLLSDVDRILDRLDDHLAEVGTRIKGMEAVRELLDREKLNAQGLLNSIEGTDIAEAVAELQHQQAVYLSALRVGAMVIRPSLVDFLAP